MKPIRFLIAGCGVLALVFLASSAWPAKTSQTKLKEAMGENFQKIQIVLKSLITSDYRGLTPKIEIIHEHAVELGKASPGFLKSDFTRRMFKNYAFGLESQSRNMLIVLKELIAHDKQERQPGMLNIDYLRGVVALHFGNIVTSCVLCHNQFRRKVIGK